MHPFTTLLFQVLDPILPSLTAGIAPGEAAAAMEHIKQTIAAAGIDKTSDTFAAFDAQVTASAAAALTPQTPTNPDIAPIGLVPIAP